ncbi:hypothetical protein Patl1_20656 [Pistacia atlantica]|uniref:Uncharacterized protein n=1 Tax=Pistacia atlantica TaxID=434234 RepID=A0ACC1BI55_9ROSI|nr:hypothetical protein Patl1_20656 [Pistacia atlantica]
MAAICKVLSDATYSSKRYWHVEYELNLNIDRQFKTVSKRRFPVCKPDTVVSSDHVFLWCNCNTFDFREFIDDTEAIINFNFINEWHHKDVGYVKKCGVHLFYTQEFEEPTRNSTRFFILDEEEEQSSSRCGMLPEYGKEVEAFNQMTYQSMMVKTMEVVTVKINENLKDLKDIKSFDMARPYLVLLSDGRQVNVIERDLSEPGRILGEVLEVGEYLKLTELVLKALSLSIFSKDGKCFYLNRPSRSFHHGVSYKE